VLKECWRLSYISLEDQTQACDIQPIRGERLPKGRVLSHTDLAHLFEACAGDPTPMGRRDAALITLLYEAGLRRSEAVHLGISDYDADSGALKIRAGKGNKDRLLYAGNGSADALKAWLAARGDASGPLLLPVSRGGHLQSRRLTDKAVTWILELRATQAGVKVFSPHDLRRSYISHMLSTGVDLPTVSALVGHASVTITAKYDRRGDDQKRKAASLLVVPYVAP